MKDHRCHCGFKSQLAKLRAHKLGTLGVILFGLHILFHVVECLIVPAILVGVGGHFHDDIATASESMAANNSAQHGVTLISQIDTL